MSMKSFWKEVSNLSQRSADKEFMDDPAFQGKDLTDSFRFIKLINQLGGGRMAVINCMKKALRSVPHQQPISVLDVGCGIGDMGNAIIRWGKGCGRQINYIGLEKSEFILREAEKQPHDENITFIHGDLFSNDLPEVDLTIISMVLHHLDDLEVVAAIRHLTGNSRIALLINELERSIYPFLLCQLLALAMPSHSSRYDALLSIRKGFTTKEMLNLIAGAGLSGSVRRGLGWRILGVVPVPG
ncbi:MAG: methyltransferase type 12 [uncultured bacterium]|nr:MAG: methyltransferase type 12 [uncultured bacterium]